MLDNTPIIMYNTFEGETDTCHSKFVLLFGKEQKRLCLSNQPARKRAGKLHSPLPQERIFRLHLEDCKILLHDL